MKISEVISDLQKCLDKFGDIECDVLHPDSGQHGYLQVGYCNYNKQINLAYSWCWWNEEVNKQENEGYPQKYEEQK